MLLFWRVVGDCWHLQIRGRACPDSFPGEELLLLGDGWHLQIIGQARGKRGVSVGKAGVSRGIFGVSVFFGGPRAWKTGVSNCCGYPYYNIREVESSVVGTVGRGE